MSSAGHRHRSTRAQVEPTDPLIVQVAEVQTAVGPDRQSVGVVDLAIRVARCPRADQRRHGRSLHQGRRGGQQGERRLQRVSAMHRVLQCHPSTLMANRTRPVSPASLSADRRGPHEIAGPTPPTRPLSRILAHPDRATLPASTGRICADAPSLDAARRGSAAPRPRVVALRLRRLPVPVYARTGTITNDQPDRPIPSRGGPVSEGSDAFDYTTLRRDIARAVARLCPRWLSARRDDLVQIAVMRVMQIAGRREASGEGSEALASSYLYKVAYSVLVDEIRRMRRRPEIEMEESTRRGGGHRGRQSRTDRRLPGDRPGNPGLPRVDEAGAPTRGHAAPAGALGAGGGAAARLGREADREPGLPRPGRPAEMPAGQGGTTVTETRTSDERLAEAFRAIEDPSADLSDDLRERIWLAVSGQLPAEDRRAIVERMAHDPACAEAWRVAHEMWTASRSAAQVPRAARSSSSRRSATAAPTLVAVDATVAGRRGGASSLPPRLAWSRCATVGLGDEFRTPDGPAVVSSIPEDAALPRDAFRLQWTPGPPGSRYRIRVTTEDLTVLVTADESDRPGIHGGRLGARASAGRRQSALAGGGQPAGRATDRLAHLQSRA